MQAMNFNAGPFMIRLSSAVILRTRRDHEIACQHMYPYVKNMALVPLDNQPQLKGADACLFATAHRLRLGVGVRLWPPVDPHRNVASDCEKDATQVCIEHGERELLKPHLVHPSLQDSEHCRCKAASCCYC